MSNKLQLTNAIKIALFFFVFFIFSACNTHENSGKRTKYSKEQDVTKDSTAPEKAKYVSTFKTDSTLQKKTVDMVYLFSDTEKDTLVSLCNCQKNVKNNTLKIQLRIAFPPRSELEAGKKGNRLLLLESIPVQYRFLGFHLKDSTVEKIEILAASTEKQFDNGEKIDSFSTKQYQLRVTKFNYKIAQDIWGTYEIVLPKDFGYFNNDRTIRGTFHCNNWKVETFKDMEAWVNLKPYKNKGFLVE